VYDDVTYDGALPEEDSPKPPRATRPSRTTKPSREISSIYAWSFVMEGTWKRH
jgi:hypothetical protein